MSKKPEDRFVPDEGDQTGTKGQYYRTCNEKKCNKEFLLNGGPLGDRHTKCPTHRRDPVGSGRDDLHERSYVQRMHDGSPVDDDPGDLPSKQRF